MQIAEDESQQRRHAGGMQFLEAHDRLIGSVTADAVIQDLATEDLGQPIRPGIGVRDFLGEGERIAVNGQARVDRRPPAHRSAGLLR